MKYFIKASTERSEIVEFLVSKPLLFSVLFECSLRARRQEKKCRITNIKQGEFVISETEFKKFGLRKTQKNKLARAIKSLVDLKIIEKTGNKTGNAQCLIYRLLDLSIFMPHFENGEQNREVTGNGRGTVGERSGTKEECIEGKERKEGKNIYAPKIEKESVQKILDVSEKVFGQKKMMTDSARKKLKARLKNFTVDEICDAFLNLENEPDQWKLSNNGGRTLAWWLHSDDRILEMQNCHLKKTKNGGKVSFSPVE